MEEGFQLCPKLCLYHTCFPQEKEQTVTIALLHYPDLVTTVQSLALSYIKLKFGTQAVSCEFLISSNWYPYT